MRLVRSAVSQTADTLLCPQECSAACFVDIEAALLCNVLKQQIQAMPITLLCSAVSQSSRYALCPTRMLCGLPL